MQRKPAASGAVMPCVGSGDRGAPADPLGPYKLMLQRGVDLVVDSCATIVDTDVGTVFGELSGRPSSWPVAARRAYFFHLTRRFLLPTVPLLISVASLLIGAASPHLYMWGVVPLWYFVNVLIMVYPFSVLFPSQHTRWMSQPLLAQAALITSATVGIEALASVRSKEFSWVVGNTTFAVIGLFGIPLLVYAGGDVLVYRGDRPVSPSTSPVVASPIVVVHHHGQGDGDADAIVMPPQAVSETLAVAQAVALGGRYSDATGRLSRRRHMSLDLSSASSTALYVTAINFVFGLAIVWLGYLTSDAQQASFYWRLLYLLLPLQLALIGCDKSSQRYSFPYAVFYAVVIVRMPDFLGHLSLQIFAMIEAETGEHAPKFVSLVKLALSVGYIVIMQLYFMVLSSVTAKMAEPSAFPRFLFIGQVYYYLFWYRMMATDGATDSLFWGMLVLMNLNYVMGSTGAYIDLLRGVVPGRYSASMPIDWVSGHAPVPPDVAASASQELFYRMKVAEQDTLADLACLAAVPTITTVLVLLNLQHQAIGQAPAAPNHAFNLENLWFRFICMAMARSVSARVERAIFAKKFAIVEAALALARGIPLRRPRSRSADETAGANAAVGGPPPETEASWRPAPEPSASGASPSAGARSGPPPDAPHVEAVDDAGVATPAGRKAGATSHLRGHTRNASEPPSAGGTTKRAPGGDAPGSQGSASRTAVGGDRRRRSSSYGDLRASLASPPTAEAAGETAGKGRGRGRGRGRASRAETLTGAPISGNREVKRSARPRALAPLRVGPRKGGGGGHARVSMPAAVPHHAVVGSASKTVERLAVQGPRNRPYFSTTMDELSEAFWYYAMVLALCAFACFQQHDRPTRFAFFHGEWQPWV